VYGPKGIYTFRIQGELCHEIGCLLPPPNKTPAFAQIYVHESNYDEQVALRMSHHHGNLHRITVGRIQDSLYQCGNPFIEAFRTAGERLAIQTNISLRLRCVTTPYLDPRRYNHPTVHEVAAIMVGSDTNPMIGPRDIIIQARGGGLKRILDIHSSYLPLRYPLIFPYGTPGWHDKLRSLTDSARYDIIF
jgi:hypothetical protein